MVVVVVGGVVVGVGGVVVVVVYFLNFFECMLANIFTYMLVCFCRIYKRIYKVQTICVTTLLNVYLFAHSYRGCSSAGKYHS